jgi:hypothetical protein
VNVARNERRIQTDDIFAVSLVAGQRIGGQFWNESAQLAAYLAESDTGKTRTGVGRFS